MWGRRSLSQSRRLGWASTGTGPRSIRSAPSRPTARQPPRQNRIPLYISPASRRTKGRGYLRSPVRTRTSKAIPAQATLWRKASSAARRASIGPAGRSRPGAAGVTGVDVIGPCSAPPPSRRPATFAPSGRLRSLNERGFEEAKAYVSIAARGSRTPPAIQPRTASGFRRRGVITTSLPVTMPRGLGWIVQGGRSAPTPAARSARHARREPVRQGGDPRDVFRQQAVSGGAMTSSVPSGYFRTSDEGTTSARKGIEAHPLAGLSTPRRGQRRSALPTHPRRRQRIDSTPSSSGGRVMGFARSFPKEPPPWGSGRRTRHRPGTARAGRAIGRPEREVNARGRRRGRGDEVKW